MPSKPRNYNNQRPLNPRHAIIAPLGAAPTNGFVSVRSVIQTGPKELTVQFDGPVDTAGSVPWFKVSVPGESADLHSWLIGEGTDTGPSDVDWTVHNRENTYAEAVMTFEDLADPIDAETMAWFIDAYDSDDTSFVGRLFNPTQAGVIATP